MLSYLHVHVHEYTCTCTQCTHVHVSFLLSENYGNIIHERVDTEWITNGLVNTYTIYSGL